MDEGVVRMQAQMYAIIALIEAVKASIAGMQADNQERISEGFALAWRGSDFEDCRHKLEELARQLREDI